MNELTEELKKGTTDLKEVMSLYNNDLFNRVPFEGSWTAGQVAEHILLSLKGMPIVLNRNVIPTDRDPQQHVQELREIFLNYNVKFEAAPNLRPSDGHHDVGEIGEKILNVLEKLVDISETESLDMLCTGFEFPNIGQLTRIELLNFTSVHTQRHIRQMRNIRKHL